MSGHAAGRVEIGDPEGLYIQYEDIDQQNETYVVGMWAFLVTEVMFFGALFAMYSVYRWRYQDYFYVIHKELNVTLGAINTTVLLLSSFSMALAVYFAQHRQKFKQLACLAATNLCALTFLVIKFFEYKAKIEHHHLPGPTFHWDNPQMAPQAQLFFSMYFAMTGLHGVHILVGILIISTLMVLIARDSKYVRNDYIPTELIGLYWHFVDLVWIFLFPLFYLMPQ